MSCIIQNRIPDTQVYLETNPCPTELQHGTYECHVFLSPVNPDDETVAIYNEATERINAKRLAKNKNYGKMKPCHLALDFKNKGYVRVMQSARYVVCNTLKDAIAEVQRDADDYIETLNELLKERKSYIQINVIREKLECLASTDGVPKSDEDGKAFNKHYFEAHIKIEKENNDHTTAGPINDNEIKEIEMISQEFSEKFAYPVPFSYNAATGSEYQRFLNIRVRNAGCDTFRDRINQIVNAINGLTHFKWAKTIAEYIPYDSLPQLDQGWIDPPEKVEISNVN